MRLWFVLLAFAATTLTSGALPEWRNQGVYVESVLKNSAGDSAGLRPGDIIKSWSRAAVKGDIRSPFDLADVETEQSPRGTVVLTGQRGSKVRHWSMAPTGWGVQTRPLLEPALLNLYRTGQALEKAGRRSEASRCWRAAAMTAQEQIKPLLSTWFLFHLADSLAQASDWKQCDEAYQDAIPRASDAGPMTLMLVLQAWADTFNKRGDWLRADKYYQQEAEECRKIAPKSFGFSRALCSLGRVANQRGDLAEAEQYYTRSLTVAQNLAPESLPVATSLHNLGNVYAVRGDLARAERYYNRAMTVCEKVAPESLEAAGVVNGLGNVFFQRGDLARAQIYFRRSLALREKLAPDSLELATSLDNLGLLSWQRGDLSSAEEYELRAVDIQKKLAPESLYEAASLNCLGLVFSKRGDLAKAEEYYGHALAIRGTLAPGSLDFAESCNNFGNVLVTRGDLGNAERHLRQGLAICERLAPEGHVMAGIRQSLGDIVLKRGDLANAEAYYRGALVIREKRSPGGLAVGASLYSLGQLALERGDLFRAEEYCHDALRIRQKLAPGSAKLAETLAVFGQVKYRRRHFDAAAQLYDQALTALEHQTVHLGGTEAIRSDFRSKYASYYRDYEDILLAQNKAQAAFHVLERSRARSLLEMLAERDLVFSADLAPGIRLERQQNAIAYDHAQARIASLRPREDAPEIERLLKRLQDLERERDEITEQVRRTSPRLAALQYPQPRSLLGARKVLDPGTVLLSYSVGPDHTTLFAVQPAGNGTSISVFTLPIGEKALREQVNRFRDVIWHVEFQRQSQDLYDLLVRPAEQIIACGRRILVCPDGPLDTLPFAALLRNKNQYLIEWKPLHSIQSATLYAEVKGRRFARNAPRELVIFGDPEYPAAAPEQNALPIARSELRGGRNGFVFSRLPFTRLEANAIAALYPGHSHVFLGPAATEERAKSIGRDVRYLHFATHALLDQRFPLNSALVLTIPEHPTSGQDNGLLQAWEIFEHVRIDADLVTLSACQTGLGQEQAGEGLIGLTRAFLYAGAHSILASKWTVQDVSTAELMKRFYGHLKNGASKDEALQQAQIELMHLPQFARPCYWAAFFLIGDPL